MRDLRGRQIGLAVALAAGLHLAAAAVVLRGPAGGGTGGVGSGAGGIGITLGTGSGGPAGGGGLAAGSPELAGPMAQSETAPDAILAETAPEVVTAEPVMSTPITERAPELAQKLARAETVLPDTPVVPVAPALAPIVPPEPAEPAVQPAEIVEATPPAAEPAPSQPQTEMAEAEPVLLAAIPTEMVDAAPPTEITATAPASEVAATLDEALRNAPVPRAKPPIPENLPELEKAEPAPVRQAQPHQETPEPPAAPKETKKRTLVSRAPASADVSSTDAGQGMDGALSEKGAWGAGGSSGNGASGGGVAGGGASGGGGVASAGSGAARQSFMVEVASWLNRHKRYPRRARRRGDEGTGVLRFVMNSQGQVLSASIVRSSGSAALDDEILEMVERAEPLPAIPPELGMNTLKITVPVGFTLR